jgi:RNA polymerase sigma-70 factor (ECF subfamily)
MLIETRPPQPAARGDVPDDVLMQAVAGGDAAAFRCLVERHQAAAFRLAWRLTGDRGDAEDLVQDGFARLWRGAAGWQAGRSGVGAWLQRVITNAAIDRSRRQRPATMAEPPDRADDSPRADALLEAGDEAARIGACVRALPDRQRAAIVLTYWEGLANAEAAARMEMNIKAFESLLLRARTALKQQLAAAGLAGGEAQP